jgi:hypothetical protein
MTSIEKPDVGKQSKNRYLLVHADRFYNRPYVTWETLIPTAK